MLIVPGAHRSCAVFAISFTFGYLIYIDNVRADYGLCVGYLKIYMFNRVTGGIDCDKCGLCCR